MDPVPEKDLPEGVTMRKRALGAAFAAVLCAGAVQAQTGGARLMPVPPPPMGWSSWNSFSNTVDAQIVMEQARAMASNGMQKAGYQYINIDEGWWLGKREADGSFVVDEKAWPALEPGEKAGDMANIVRFIHKLGLKAGIYTDAGANGCSMYPDLGPPYPNVGSEGHYEQDFLQFARWGFDYVKVDWCGGDKENLDPAVQYAEIARAIERARKITGHALYYSICNWGKNSPWTWAPNVGGIGADVWRTSGDIVDPIVASGSHADRKAGFDKMLGNFDKDIHPEAQHSGFYNDPDMMVIGMPGFTDVQNRVHMSLWAISGAPLLVGADLTKLTPETLSMLTNPAVLAIDQDAAGLQAVKVAEPAKGIEVWNKALARPGSRAVLLLNRTSKAQQIEARWSDLGLEGSHGTVKNLWTGDSATGDGVYSTQVAAGDAVLIRIDATEAPFTRYQPGKSSSGIAASAGEVSFTHVASKRPWARIAVTYSNPGQTTEFAELRVDGRIATRIAFPPTGSESGSIMIQAQLETGEDNQLDFAAIRQSAPLIHSIAVQ
jgi:hypothetical protein